MLLFLVRTLEYFARRNSQDTGISYSKMILNTSGNINLAKPNVPYSWNDPAPYVCNKLPFRLQPVLFSPRNYFLYKISSFSFFGQSQVKICLNIIFKELNAGYKSRMLFKMVI